MIACEVSPSDACPKLLACRTRTKIWLATLVAIQLALYGWLTLLSSEFRFESVGASRPLTSFFAILATVFVAYLGSIPLALRLGDSAKCLTVLFLVAIAIRSMVVFSEPIQEVDIYRYIWDGAVSSEGISPYRFRPAEVQQLIAAAEAGAPADDDLQRIAGLAQHHAGLQAVLGRVHFGELPTVYPPVSQLVFRFCHWITPHDAAATTRVRMMKSVMVLFDLGVMWLLFLLLRVLQRNPAWCIAYGWSPLAIKEFANSGHLDSIAVFLCMAAILCIASAYRRATTQRWQCPPSVCLVSSGVLLGLGVGAKLYPVVLLPLIACLIGRLSGLRLAITWTSVACLVGALSLAPMISGRGGNPTPVAAADGSGQLQGLTTFLSRWEMNDLLFMAVEENLRPEGSVAGQPHLWFAIVPTDLRSKLTGAASSWFAGDIERTPFLLTRLLTTYVFAAIAAFLCGATWKDPERFYEAAFLTLAWFWLLAPTQNPWYWSWALPLVPLARNRSWLLVSGLTLIYYARFWFEYHGADTTWFGYQGVAIFDFIVVWIEFGPLLVLLAFTAAHSSRNGLPAS